MAASPLLKKLAKNQQKTVKTGPKNGQKRQG